MVTKFVVLLLVCVLDVRVSAWRHSHSYSSPCHPSPPPPPLPSANFNDLFGLTWAPDRVVFDGDTVKMKLDNTSGSGFSSKNKYLYGSVSVQIKLVPRDSAGTVTAFYMSSGGDAHDELDFEFLGNQSGQPYIVQTNVYVNGSGNREQRHYLWFDPTQDFHSYSFLWNRHQILFLVDGIPIRAHTNKDDDSLINIVNYPIIFPKKQAMWIYGSIWNGDDWATQGGRIKTNWSNAPFVSEFKGFHVDACEVLSIDDVKGKCADSVGEYWWDGPALSGLSPHQQRQLKWVRTKYLVYDYCKDDARFAGVMPFECQSN